MRNRLSHILGLYLFVCTGFILLSCSDKDESEPDQPVEVPLIEKMMILVTTTKTELTVKLPLTGTIDCEIDWDDEKLETTSELFPTHTYAEEGKYLVAISGTVTGLSTSDFSESELLRITAVYNWGKTGLTTMRSAFKGCTGLISIVSDYEQEAFSNVTDFNNAFSNCPNLTGIPTGLFDHCIQATSFSNVFANCSSLTEIPTGLFGYCTEADNFGSAFLNCKSLKEIPAGLFDNCIYAENFSSTFQNCESLINIPTDLFDNCKRISNLLVTFAGCKGLQGESPYTIIDGNKIHLYERDSKTSAFDEPRYFYLYFDECTGLSDYTNIPEDWK